VLRCMVKQLTHRNQCHDVVFPIKKNMGRRQPTLQIFNMLVPPGEPMGSPQVMA
jgi:hypothetical protein